jgi:hypothetical protein
VEQQAAAQVGRQLTEIQALQTRHHESQVALQIERERLEAHMRAVEDRAHQKIDRARQDAKLWQQRHEIAERSRREAIDTAQKRYDAISSEVRHLEQEVARQAGQITALEKALSERRTPRHRPNGPHEQRPRHPNPAKGKEPQRAPATSNRASKDDRISGHDTINGTDDRIKRTATAPKGHRWLPLIAHNVYYVKL